MRVVLACDLEPDSSYAIFHFAIIYSPVESPYRNLFRFHCASCHNR
jgi:hypothetical protein